MLRIQIKLLISHTFLHELQICIKHFTLNIIFIQQDMMRRALEKAMNINACQDLQNVVHLKHIVAFCNRTSYLNESPITTLICD